MHYSHLYREMVQWNVVKQKNLMCEQFFKPVVVKIVVSVVVKIHLVYIA